MSKTVKNDKAIIKMLMENYIKLEASIVEELNMRVKHPTMLGTNREVIWKSLFEQIIPKKFAIEQSVFIIDSQGRVSNEIDLAIFDEQYTPYIFKYGTLKFLPIESVVCVVECKSKRLPKTSLLSWVKKLGKLETEVNSIARTISGVKVNGGDKGIKLAQTATRPIRILCHISDDTLDKETKNVFDFIIGTEGKKLTITIENKREMANWYQELNHVGNQNNDRIIPYPSRADAESTDFYNPSLDSYSVLYRKNGVEQQNAILTLIFQLNQLLMLLNNPMPFPHRAYVECFNNIGRELEEPYADSSN